MLDRWVSEVNPAPARFLKITGRYRCRNIGPLLRRVGRPRRPLIIDVRPRPRAALSSLFLVDTDFYREHLLGEYENCDEDAKRWAERVLYNRLSQLPEGKIESLPLEPDWAGISGTFGTRLETPRWRFHLKGVCRRVNRLIDRERLWYGKH